MSVDAVRFRVRDGVAMLRIKDPSDRWQDFFGSRVLPKWASHNKEQIKHFLDLGMIECADDSGRPTDPDRAWECLSALIACGVPEEAGRPRAADILRAEGLRYSNETISRAIALRKSGAKYEAPQ